jgi:hypothetical protein
MTLLLHFRQRMRCCEHTIGIEWGHEVALEDVVLDEGEVSDEDEVSDAGVAGVRFTIELLTQHTGINVEQVFTAIDVRQVQISAGLSENLSLPDL